MTPGTPGNRDKEIKAGWGEWLNSFEWSHFVTLTFRFPSSANQALGRFRGWARWVGRYAGRGIYWFAVVETVDDSNLHVHALLGDARDVESGRLESSWRWGRAEALPYRDGGAFYVSKGLDQDEAEYSLSKRVWRKRAPASAA